MLVDVVEFLDGVWEERGAAGCIGNLLQDEPLLQLLDAWLCELSDTDFIDSLPLLRRSMSNFDSVARRRLLEAVQRGRRQGTPAAPHVAKESNVAPGGAFEAALPLLYKILGLGQPS